MFTAKNQNHYKTHHFPLWLDDFNPSEKIHYIFDEQSYLYEPIENTLNKLLSGIDIMNREIIVCVHEDFMEIIDNKDNDFYLIGYYFKSIEEDGSC